MVLGKFAVDRDAKGETDFLLENEWNELWVQRGHGRSYFYLQSSAGQIDLSFGVDN